MKRFLIFSILALAVALSANTVDFMADITSVGAGHVAYFIPMCDPEPTEYLWSFGDGETSAEQYPNHAYISGGSYTVSLTAFWDSYGETETKIDYMNVIQARFNITQDTGYAPFTTGFTNTSLGTFTESVWDFGDGTDPVINPSSPIRHTYHAGGDFDVSLSIADTLGANHTVIQYSAIHVTNNLTASISADVTSGSAPLQVHFYSNGQGSIQSYHWDFGDDSSPSYEANPYHTFYENGIYTISLTYGDSITYHTTVEQDFIVVGTVVETVTPLDGIWLIQNSPFIIYQNAQIEYNGILNIDQGVVVFFNDGQIFQIGGELNASGATFRELDGGVWGGIVYNSSGSGLLQDCDILGAQNGIVIQRDGRNNRETPTLTNLRIKSSSSATRPEGTGLTIEGSFDDTLDNITIEGYDYGVDIDNLQGSTTPTLTNIRIKQSSSATRTGTEAININGLCEPNLDNIVIENFDKGISISNSGNDPLATPTLTNIRIKTSDSATRSATTAISLNNVTDIRIGGETENDSIVIENYPMGIQILQSPTREVSTPTLTNLRIKTSDSATRVDTSAIVIQGPVEAQIHGVTIENYVTGIDYDGEGTVRETPVITNLRIKSSSSATRTATHGMRIQNLDSIIIGGEGVQDSVIIEGCDTGIMISSGRSRSRSTPTLTNIRVKTSSSATRQDMHGIHFAGSVTANVHGAILDGYDYGIFYDMDPDYGVRETPTLTNLRIKSSSSATREAATGIFLMNVGSIIIGDSTQAEDVTIEGFQNGVQAYAFLRDISTPTLTNLRIKSSSSATRNVGDGIYFGPGTGGVIRDCKIDDFGIGINLDVTTAVQVYDNSLFNNDTGLSITSVVAPVAVHHNLIYLGPDFNHYMPGQTGILMNYVAATKAHNNTIYNYDFGSSIASSDAVLNMNIVWSDTQYDSAIQHLDSNSSIQVEYNNMLGYDTINGNIDADPKFIDAENGNFTLRANSPCINAGDPDFNGNGTNWYSDPLDQDPDGTQMDIGAFCYDANTATIPGQPQDGLPTGNNVSTDFPFIHWSDDIDVYRWTINLDYTSDFSSPNAIINSNLTDNQYELATGFLMSDTPYWVKISPRNIRDEYGPPLEWTFNTQMPNGSADHDNGTGLAGDVIETSEWLAGFYQLDFPQVGDVQYPAIIFFPNTIPTETIAMILELGIKGGLPGSDQRTEYENFIANMAAVGAPEDLDMAIRITSTDDTVYNGSLSFNLIGYPYEINFIYYSLNEGAWIEIPMWESGISAPYFTYDGSTLVITGLSMGRAEGDLDIGFGGSDFTLPVSLSSFTATTTTSGFIQLNWVAQSEVDLLGYNLYRAEEEDLNEAALVTIPMIDALNSEVEVTYEYTDEDVIDNNTYHYWLQIVELNGTCDFFGPISVTVDDDPEAPPADEYITALHGNFPNPFNPETRIDFSIAEQCDVTISIYNVKGQRVRTYQFDDCQEGNHIIHWTGDDDTGKSVASSVYFIKMETDNYKKIHKALLIK